MARFVTPQKIAELMGMKQPVAESDGTPLCPTHYRQLHRTLHSHDHMYNKRKCIVCNCTVHSYIQLPPIEKHGWKMKEQSLVVEWDTEENIKGVQSRVALLLRGCGCKKGCDTRQCSCKRAGNECGPGCRCMNCHNRPPEPTSTFLSIRT